MTRARWAPRLARMTAIPLTRARVAVADLAYRHRHAADRESLRLLRDLHDDVGPTLTGLALGMDAAWALAVGRPDLQALLRMLKADAQRALTDVRRIAYGLPPPVLDGPDLRASPGEDIRRLSGEGPALAVSQDISGDSLTQLPSAFGAPAYRIVTQPLTNVAQLAHAKRCSVRVHIGPAMPVEVRDDGGSASDETLDVELDRNERDGQLLLHLSRCSRCRDLVNAVGTLRRRVNAALGEAAASAGLTGRLMSLGDMASDDGVRPQIAKLTAARDIRAALDADRAVVELYNAHYRSLVRLTILLVGDVETAEEIVQDAFDALDGGWPRLPNNEKALAYLRQSAVNRCRSVLRNRVAVDRYPFRPPPDMPSTEHGAIALLERSAVIAALRTLSERQREALVLRFYAELSEAEIAEAMQISIASAKSHTASAIATLRTLLETEQ